MERKRKDSLFIPSHSCSVSLGGRLCNPSWKRWRVFSNLPFSGFQQGPLLFAPVSSVFSGSLIKFGRCHFSFLMVFMVTSAYPTAQPATASAWGAGNRDANLTQTSDPLPACISQGSRWQSIKLTLVHCYLEGLFLCERNPFKKIPAFISPFRTREFICNKWKHIL